MPLISSYILCPEKIQHCPSCKIILQITRLSNIEYSVIVALKNLESHLHENVAAFVIDEAHTGNKPSGFRSEAYESCRIFRERCGESVPVLLTTATPTRGGMMDMCEFYGLRNPFVIKTSPKREIIKIQVRQHCTL